MEIKEKLYVTVASWSKRINNIKTIVEYMLAQTLQPYKVIINLCTYDFPNMEEDLPKDLLDFINKHSDKVEIYWYIENYMAWKKHIHVLEYVNDDDLIVSIDDDWVYPPRFLESLYLSYLYYGKKYPICNDKRELTGNFWSFYGPGTLYWKGCFPKDYKKYLTHDILHCRREDLVIIVLLAINKVPVLPNKFKIPKLQEFNSNEPMTIGITPEEHAKLIQNSIDVLNEVILKFYCKNKVPQYYPYFWKVFEDFYNYLITIENPFPEMQFVLNCYKENYLCSKADVIEGDWIEEKLHLNIDIWS